MDDKDQLHLNASSTILSSMKEPTITIQNHLKSKLFWVALYTILTVMGLVNLGYMMAEDNQLQPILNVLYGWEGSQQTLQNSLVTSIGIVGAGIGTLSAIKLLELGRRRLLLFGNILAIVFIGLMLIRNIYVLYFSKLFYGICCGIMATVETKMIAETVPVDRYSVFGVFPNCGITFGQLVPVALGLGLQTVVEGMTSQEDINSYWRLIFGFPAVFCFISLIGLLFIFKDDSIDYSVDKGSDDQALNLIKIIYSEKPQQVLMQMKEERLCRRDDSQQISIFEALYSVQHRIATWFCIILIVFNQFTGINGVIFYSNTILSQMNEESSFPLSPQAGALLVGVINLIASFLAILSVNNFRRRTVMLYGHSLMSLSLILVGVLQRYGYSIGVLAFLLVFVSVFQTSQGPLALLYSAEVVCQPSMAICMFTLMLCITIISLTTQPLFEGVGASGAFFIYGGITTIGFFYFLLLMRETKGLSNKDKQLVYAPKKNYLKGQFQDDE